MEKSIMNDEKIAFLHRKSTGFGLIEIMVTLVIISIAILALNSLQGTLFVSNIDAKARVEAAAIAEEKLEAFRGFRVDEAVSYASATDWYDNVSAATSVFVTQQQGSVAEYDISYVLSGTKETFSSGVLTVTENQPVTFGSGEKFTKLMLEIGVSWDADGGLPVSAATELTYVEDDAFSRIIQSLVESGIVAAPTGRAKIGAGNLEPYERDIINGTTTDTNNQMGKEDGVKDGVVTFQRASGDVVLVEMDSTDESTTTAGKILLTLEEACVSAATCTDFTKLRGTIFVEKDSDFASANTSTSWFVDHSGDPEFYLNASDAAYCTYYHGSSVDGSDLFVGGSASATNPLSTPRYTANGDYEYLDYVCYVGAGWYGNIGMIFPSTASHDNDVMCLGDPNNASYDDYSPDITIRRAYRGMLRELSGASPLIISGNEVYASIGIQDAITLLNQDIVVTSTGETNGDRCYKDSGGSIDSSSALYKGDSGSGSLFQYVRNQFVCLNSDVDLELDSDASDGVADISDASSFAFVSSASATYVGIAESITPDVDGEFMNDGGQVAEYADASVPKASLWTGLTGDYDRNSEQFLTGNYEVMSSCPYDPTTPPANQFTFDYEINIDLESGTTDPYKIDSDIINTSDENTYPVRIYTSDRNLECPITSIDVTNDILTYQCRVYTWDTSAWSGYITAVPLVDGFSCAPIETGTITPDFSVDPVTIASTFSGQTCATGYIAVITGQINSYSSSFYKVQSLSLDDSVTGECVLFDSSTTLNIVDPTAGEVAGYYRCVSASYPNVAQLNSHLKFQILPGGTKSVSNHNDKLCNLSLNLSSGSPGTLTSEYTSGDTDISFELEVTNSSAGNIDINFVKFNPADCPL